MDYNDVHKFGDQTLKFVSIQLKEKLKCHREGVNVGWNHDRAREAMKIIDRIEARLKFRDQIRRMESLVGGREPIPNILTYHRPNHPSS